MEPLTIVENMKDALSDGALLDLSSEPDKHSQGLLRKRGDAWISNHKRRANPEYRIAESKKNSERIKKYRLDLVSVLGAKCVVCSYSNGKALQLDHIYGQGKKDRIIRSNCYYLKNTGEAKTRLQVLCANCNWIKVRQSHEVPPGRKRKVISITTEQKLGDGVKYNRTRRADPEFRARESKTNAARINKYRTDLIEMFGARCIICGYTDVRALHLDHIFGGGLRERGLNGDRSTYYNYLKHPEIARKKLQVLCANCNWIKRAENMEVAHNKSILDNLHGSNKLNYWWVC